MVLINEKLMGVLELLFLVHIEGIYVASTGIAHV